jgi:hypothetical protein
LLLCAAVAALADLGAAHGRHTGDSLLPVLVSLQRWTPYFWTQDRVGMLVPLLAMPVRSPFANLLVQDGLYFFAGLAALFLLARYALRDATYPLAGTLSAAAFLTLTPADYRFDFFLNTFYGVWLALGLGGLVLLEPRTDGTVPARRWLPALALLVLAHWVYCAAAVLLGPLVLFRGLLFARAARPAARSGWGRAALRRAARAETVFTLVLLALAFVAGQAVKELSHRLGWAPLQPLKTDALPAGEWQATWRLLYHNTWDALAPHSWPAVLGLAGLAGLVFLAYAVLRGRFPTALRAALALAAASLAFGLFMGTREWVRNFDCMDRYTKPGVFLLQGALCALAAAPLAAALGGRLRRAVALSAAPALVLAALTAYGPPSLRGARAQLEHYEFLTGEVPGDVAACTEAVIHGHCTHIAGDYWRVWPRVFHASMVLYERGEPRPVWGIAYRGEAARPAWQGMPPEQMCVAVVPEDGRLPVGLLRSFQLPPLEEVERRPMLCILRPRGRSAGRPGTPNPDDQRCERPLLP